MNSPTRRSLTDLAPTARRHLPALLLPVLVVTVASTAALWPMSVEYRSSTIVLPEPRKSDLPVSLDLARMPHSLRQQVTSRVSIEKLSIEELMEMLDLYQDACDNAQKKGDRR